MSVLDQIMGVKEAGELWGLSADRVKAICQSGEVEAKKIGKTWIIDKNQPNPKRSKNKMLIVDQLIGLNGYESGVIVFKDGEGFVVNWSGINGLPRLFGDAIIGLGEKVEFVKISKAPNDVLDKATGLALQEQNGADEEPVIDEIFECNDCYVFTFELWN
ncbi:helix-turn-helix domain-containing protein [Pullulanibacillus sp. KACC 23026]|uniref:helix-turn-helix domain-containing protein n=1 Tax=Pullulanibacillus sp. KACC 23026 TaxID=3028315 RepID=UPI0023B072D7|nr:helix-turn-helix domain-containing protein [Pullulanibacillus sp. KACC 23026]WEG14177.1 helix-turn-helix domain-containing protein [Pullulanibacillus sp. KACC 23026]